VLTKKQSTMPDPYGTPIDIAIGKDGSLYVLNIAKPDGNVAWYPGGSSQPKELTCPYTYLPEATAVDNEGDIFVQGYGHGRFTGVVEIPNGPSGPQSGQCMKLPVRSEDGTYTGGVAIDPKTDDLITTDDPSLCAGGTEGRMTIYRKPYSRRSARVKILGGNCTGGLRLNADSTMVFYGDETVSGVSTCIDASTYPEGRRIGVYSDQSFSGGPGAFTTIPNTLPN
jgi:hypothetical protein